MHPAAPAEPVYTLELRQRLTAVQNRYDVVTTRPDGTEQVLAYVEQRRFALKERVTFYADDPNRNICSSALGSRSAEKPTSSSQLPIGRSERRHDPHTTSRSPACSGAHAIRASTVGPERLDRRRGHPAAADLGGPGER